jgi:hypothetical protein
MENRKCQWENSCTSVNAHKRLLERPKWRDGSWAERSRPLQQEEEEGLDGMEEALEQGEVASMVPVGGTGLLPEGEAGEGAGSGGENGVQIIIFK